MFLIFIYSSFSIESYFVILYYIYYFLKKMSIYTEMDQVVDSNLLKNVSEKLTIYALLVIPKEDSHYVTQWYSKVDSFKNISSHFDIQKRVFMYDDRNNFLRLYNEYISNLSLNEPDFNTSTFFRMNYYHFFELSPFFNNNYILDTNLLKNNLSIASDFSLFEKFIQNEINKNNISLATHLLHSILNKNNFSNYQKSILTLHLARCYQKSNFDEFSILDKYYEAYSLCNDNLIALYEMIVKYRFSGNFDKILELIKPYFKRFGIPDLLNDSENIQKYNDFLENVVKKDIFWNSSLYTYLYFLDFEILLTYLFIARNPKYDKKHNYSIAYQLCNRLMLRKMVIADESIKQINHFKAECIDFIKDDFIFYPEEKIKDLTNASKIPDELKDRNKVIFTVTTCKRFDLFEKTMNSLINASTDIDYIQEWLCVDDNSSIEDRELMKTKYPFFTFIFKTPEEKGHAKSMNIIRDYVLQSGYKYTMHMEDDWQSVCVMDTIQKSIQIIEENTDGIRQVVHNRQYVQLIRPRDIDLKGGIQKYLKNGYRYILHEFYPNGSEAQQEFWKRVGNGFSACYWPNYSLNPSIMSTDIYKCLGPYNEQMRHFEMDYASRFTNAGFKTAFLDGIYRLHIGKLIGEEGKKNAYELNELVQFAQGS